MIDSYLAIDIEATGLSPKTDQIIEIGAIRVLDGREDAVFETFVNPHQNLSDKITELTGITDGELCQAPDISEAIRALLDFAGDLPLLGHNILCDFSYLKRAAVNQKLTFEREGLDTLYLCRAFMPGEEKKTLSAACQYFGIPPEVSHRALADARSAHLLCRELAKRYENQSPERFLPKKLLYQVKREQPASKRQKERLQELLKYHRIEAPAQPEYMTRNQISRLTDQIISIYGREKRK